MRIFVCHAVVFCLYVFLYACSDERLSNPELAIEVTASISAPRSDSGDIVKPTLTAFDPIIYDALTLQDFSWGGIAI